MLLGKEYEMGVNERIVKITIESVGSEKGSCRKGVIIMYHIFELKVIAKNTKRKGGNCLLL